LCDFIETKAKKFPGVVGEPRDIHENCSNIINFIPPFFSISSLVAILVGSWDHRTQFWKGATQGAFNQSLVAIGPVVSEEKIKM
jgi:hypothetical protein